MKSLLRVVRGAKTALRVSSQLPRISEQRCFHASVVALAKSSVRAPDPSESFLSGTSSIVLEEMYESWKQDPASVDSSWSEFFRNLDAGAPPGQAFPLLSFPRGPKYEAAVASGVSSKELENSIIQATRLMMLVRNFRVRGHLLARFDPLGLEQRAYHPELDYRNYGFSEVDLDKKFYVGSHLGLDIKEENYAYRPLREILDLMQRTYCKTIGCEFYHIVDPKQRDWIAERLETTTPESLSAEEKKKVLFHLAEADQFERYLANKYNTAKRFGLEGGESLIPGMEFLFDRAANLGVEHIVVGMPHRGRLNVLGNIMKKPLRSIFHEFQDHSHEDPSAVEGSGDVKYHLGTSTDRTFNGKKVHLSLAANPSHLEFVNAIVEGKVRAKQHFLGDKARSKVMPVLLHGDAAFAGQGIVAETLAMCDLTAYCTGGTIHIVVNNQIGFTTDPFCSRSTPYCTDVAKAVGAPVFHVNGDDPIAVAHVCRIAAEWRQTFHRDVVIDIVCYRRHGHNELDQPMFTQPKMYKKIAAHPPTLDLFGKQLVEQNIISSEEVTGVIKTVVDKLDAEFAQSRSFHPKVGDWLEGNWEGYKKIKQRAQPKSTAVSSETLRRIGMAITDVPADFKLHPGVARVYKQRRQMVETGKDLDWAMGEQLAFATLLDEGFPVRLSGQDCERGTFSHRHSVLHDQDSQELGRRVYIPLEHISPKQATFRVANSHLSEAAVLGFEVGYSLEHPKILVMWEAQFGDFANGAQVIIDQFISSGEAKWTRQSGLTMLLPHGFDGQGPEHSSARPERYLQMVDENPEILSLDADRQLQECNMQVVNVTMPSNFFHLLRRQVHREFRKPLIVMSPKKLLRHKLVNSDIKEFAEGSGFQRVYPEVSSDLVAADKVKRVVLCSGQVYFDLFQKREEAGIKDIAIVRVEQIAPFPFDLVAKELATYSNAEVVWCQEEPMNSGYWAHVSPRIETASNGRIRAKYIGRAPSAAPATGFSYVHAAEQETLLRKALMIETPAKKA